MLLMFCDVFVVCCNIYKFVFEVLLFGFVVIEGVYVDVFGMDFVSIFLFWLSMNIWFRNCFFFFFLGGIRCF